MSEFHRILRTYNDFLLKLVGLTVENKRMHPIKCLEIKQIKVLNYVFGDSFIKRLMCAGKAPHFNP